MTGGPKIPCYTCSDDGWYFAEENDVLMIVPCECKCKPFSCAAMRANITLWRLRSDGMTVFKKALEDTS